MNQESYSHGELVRPVPSPAVVISAAPGEVARAVPVSPVGLARPASAATLTPMSILRALQRRQLLALGVAIVAAGIGGPAAWYLVPSKFKVQARLQVAAQPPKLLYRTAETEAINGDDYKRYQTTQLNLVKTRLVLNAALSDQKVKTYRIIREQKDPLSWLLEKLTVEFIAGSEVMEISMSGDNPDELAGIVNAVKKAYMEEVVNKDNKVRQERHLQLKKLNDQYAGMLKERREHLRKLAETVGSDDPKTLALKQQYALDHLDHVRKDLLDVQSEKRKLQARFHKAQQPDEPQEETVARSFSEAEIAQWIDRHPDMVALLDRLAQDEQRLSSATVRTRSIARSAGSDPVLRQLRVAMEGTERLLKSKRAALRPIAIRRLQEQNSTETLVRGNDDQQHLAELEDLERLLIAELKSVTDQNQVQTVKTLDLQKEQDDVAQMQQYALRTAAEVEALRVELEAPQRISGIEDAEAPKAKDNTRRYATIGLVIFGSFFGGLFGIAFLELHTRKVDSADEVPADLGLHVVGTLPIVRTGSNRGGITLRKAERDRYCQNMMLESIDATRTMLVHAARTGSHRVVMITSAVAGEGKTSLASHLSTSLARSGLRTLLIDADLRSPSIHRLFDLPVTAGLSELLRGEIELADAIRSTPIGGLQILSAGICDRQTISLIAQGCLGPLFVQLKQQFDFVIVDSSPLLPVADGLIIAQHVDAVLFSIFRDISSKTKILAASDRLQSLRVQILGAVVTGTHGGRYGNNFDPYGPYSVLPESAAGSSDSSKS